MTLKVRDRICETSVSTGTGAMTLSGTAATGGFHKLDWCLSSGDKFWGFIRNEDVPSEFEVGLYTFTTGTVTRSVVYDSSAGFNTPVTFSAGTKNIHLCAPSEQLKWLGCVATKSGDNTAVNLTTAASITFDTNTLDTSLLGTLHSTSSNTSRLRLDSTCMGPGMVRLQAQIILANCTVGEWVNLTIVKNGATTVARSLQSCLTTNPSFQIIAPIQSAAVTDYYEVFVQVQADTSVDIKVGSWFQMEVLQ